VTAYSATNAISEEDDLPPRAKGKTVVNDKRLIRTKNFYATLSVIVPTGATAYAIYLAIRNGLSLLDLGLFLFLYFWTLMGITVGFHRQLAHRSFVGDRWVKILFAVLGTSCGQAPVLHWVSNHRRHHQTSDKPGDPHSPHLSGNSFGGRIKGLWYAHIGSMFAPEVTNFAHYSPDLLRDADLRWIDKHYLSILLSGLLLPAAIGGAVTHSLWGALTALLWGGFVRMFVVQHAIWAITSIAHTVGKQVNNSGDQSRNFFITALLTGGEGWHNNHHAFPSSAHFALSPGQIDFGGIVIWTLEKIGAVHDVRRPTPEKMKAKALR
jgi:stearoyl-CoA desaturase (delta-9 desaturase)